MILYVAWQCVRCGSLVPALRPASQPPPTNLARPPASRRRAYQPVRRGAPGRGVRLAQAPTPKPGADIVRDLALWLRTKAQSRRTAIGRRDPALELNLLQQPLPHKGEHVALGRTLGRVAVHR